MSISITDAVSLEGLAKSDPFSTGSMFKDPSAIAATKISGMTSSLGSVASLPGLDGALQLQFTGLSSSMSGYSSTISSTMAGRMASFSKDMSDVSGFVDLYDPVSPCDILNSVFGSISKIGDIMGAAMDGVKSLLKPLFDAIGNIFSAGASLLSGAVDAIHSAMGAIGSAISAATAFMAAKLAEFTNMIAKEMAALGHMLMSLVDFSYLSRLRNAHLSICGHNIIGAVSH